MASGKAERVALLSIRPAYANAIFDGNKRVEFRRSRLAPDVTRVIVYATQPVGQVIGWFDVREVIEGSPSGLWEEFAATGGIARRAYRAYFKGARRAFGIVVGTSTRLKQPRPLGEVVPGVRPPQSFQYIRASDVSAALAF